MGASDQVRETPLVPVPGVDGLPEQHHFRDARRGDLADLMQHSFRLSVLLRSPDVRDDAERAPVVAPALHGHPGHRPLGASLLEALIVLRRVQLEHRELRPGARRAAGRDLLERFGQGSIAIRTHDQIDVGGLLQQRGT